MSYQIKWKCLNMMSCFMASFGVVHYNAYIHRRTFFHEGSAGQAAKHDIAHKSKILHTTSKRCFPTNQSNIIIIGPYLYSHPCKPNNLISPHSVHNLTCKTHKAGKTSLENTALHFNSLTIPHSLPVTISIWRNIHLKQYGTWRQMGQDS